MRCLRGRALLCSSLPIDEGFDERTSPPAVQVPSKKTRFAKRHTLDDPSATPVEPDSYRSGFSGGQFDQPPKDPDCPPGPEDSTQPDPIARAEGVLLEARLLSESLASKGSDQGVDTSGGAPPASGSGG